MFPIKTFNTRQISSYYRNGLNLSVTADLHQIRKIFSTPVALKKEPDPGIKLKEKEWQLEFHQDRPESQFRIYDKTPVKVKIIEGKKYAWCACGFSNMQPFCDGTHSTPGLKITLRPIVFKAPETKEVWFCNCKKSNNRPFCDGTHRSKEVQDAFPQPLFRKPQ